MQTANRGGPPAWKFSKTKHSYRMLHRPSDFGRVCRWEGNIKMDLRNMIGGSELDTSDSGQITVASFYGHVRCGEFLD
jgi:hypothetical protein